MEQTEIKAARMGGGKRGGGLIENDRQKILKLLDEIVLKRGNVAEVYPTEHGVKVVEVKRREAGRFDGERK